MVLSVVSVVGSVSDVIVSVVKFNTTAVVTLFTLVVSFGTVSETVVSVSLDAIVALSLVTVAVIAVAVTSV